MGLNITDIKECQSWIRHRLNDTIIATKSEMEVNPLLYRFINEYKVFV